MRHLTHIASRRCHPEPSLRLRAENGVGGLAGVGGGVFGQLDPSSQKPRPLRSAQILEQQEAIPDLEWNLPSVKCLPSRELLGRRRQASERASAGGQSALGKLCEGDGATGLEQCKGGRPGHLDDGGGGGWVAGIYRASAERK